MEYELEEGKGVVKKEKTKTGPKRILEKAVTEAWQRPEMSDIKEELSEVAIKHWKPQVEEALRVTKYAEELKARARETKYGKKVEEVWE